MCKNIANIAIYLQLLHFASANINFTWLSIRTITHNEICAGHIRSNIENNKIFTLQRYMYSIQKTCSILI